MRLSVSRRKKHRKKRRKPTTSSAERTGSSAELTGTATDDDGARADQGNSPVPAGAAALARPSHGVVALRLSVVLAAHLALMGLVLGAAVAFSPDTVLTGIDTLLPPDSKVTLTARLERDGPAFTFPFGFLNPDLRYASFHLKGIGDRLSICLSMICWMLGIGIRQSPRFFAPQGGAKK